MAGDDITFNQSRSQLEKLVELIEPIYLAAKDSVLALEKVTSVEEAVTILNAEIPRLTKSRDGTRAEITGLIEIKTDLESQNKSLSAALEDLRANGEQRIEEALEQTREGNRVELRRLAQILSERKIAVNKEIKELTDTRDGIKAEIARARAEWKALQDEIAGKKL